MSKLPSNMQITLHHVTIASVHSKVRHLSWCKSHVCNYAKTSTMDHCAFTGHKDHQYLITATIQVYADSPQTSLVSLLKNGCKPNTVQPDQHPISVHAAISGTLVTLFFSTMHQYSFSSYHLPNVALQKCLWNTRYIVHNTSLWLLPLRVDAQLLMLPSACFCSYFRVWL